MSGIGNFGENSAVFHLSGEKSINLLKSAAASLSLL
jgi:hypothetical protein